MPSEQDKKHYLQDIDSLTFNLIGDFSFDAIETLNQASTFLNNKIQELKNKEKVSEINLEQFN